jgi:glycosyltransferase involved in cell wall biosynthesis
MTIIAPSPTSTSPFGPPARRDARIDIVIPVYNEQAVLPDSVQRLHAYCSAELDYEWRIVIADNASTDAT